MTTQAPAKTLLPIIRLPRIRRRTPKSWAKGAGLLRHHYQALLKHLRMVQGEWSR